MDHNQSITPPQPIDFNNNSSADLHRIVAPSQTPTTHFSSQMPLVLSPPKPFYSPENRRIASEKQISNGQGRPNLDQFKEKKVSNILFTIEENYYSRKNQNIVCPRPPKYRPPFVRPALLNDFDPSNRIRERKVIFTDNLIREERSTSSRKDSLSTKPIIRNTFNNGNGNNHYNQDNLSNSSRSLSAQNSFVSQFRSLPKREKARVDSNKQKYTQILNHFEHNRQMREQRKRNKFSRQAREKAAEKEEKYIDTIFPPVYTSLFLNPNKAKTQPAEIKWKRLSQLFQTEDLVILSKEGFSQVTILDGEGSWASESVVTAFNALRYSSCVLQKIFEDQTFNKFGLYLARIFQQHNWKSIILDEYIPVKASKDGLSLTPAFVRVQKEKEAKMELWPFLLEKAFAYYYSAYELLTFANTIDFLTQLMGLAPLQISVKKRWEKEYTNLQSSLQSVDSVAIAEYTDTKKQAIIRVRYSNEGAQMALSQPPLFKEQVLNQQIFARMGKIFLFSPKIYHSLSTSTIGKYSPNHHNNQRAEYSIRKLILTQNSDCLISVQQKQSRFFVKSSLNYHYMWMRVLLVQREFNGYRWIEGRYSNGKSVTLSPALAVGEYYLIIMPEWKEEQNFELTLLVWGNHHVSIEREKGSCEELIEQACMDLAQRKGKINQLTPTLCSYNYVCPRTGMIIENINNEKLKEDVKVHRDISGIPCQVKLLPINKEFWPEKGKMISEIDIQIPKLSSYTIVLKMRGGMDHKLIQLFSIDKESKENIK